ncbi:MAG TPA: hypothetical protein VIM11_27680, partial [Tepidisphaeraceae bacterium]
PSPLPKGEGARRRASFVRDKIWASADYDYHRVFIGPVHRYSAERHPGFWRRELRHLENPGRR